MTDGDFHFWGLEKVTQSFNLVMALQSLHSMEYSHIAVLLDPSIFLVVSNLVEI